MSDLPDLDTSQVSYVAYWNAIDQGGAGQIDPSEVTSASWITSTTLYDNGVGGQAKLPAGDRAAGFRVKTDGWFVAYITRAETFSQQNGSPPAGHYDVVHDWTDSTSQSDFGGQNSLERLINQLYRELSNSGTITYNTGDVGLYNYQISATTSTYLEWQFQGSDFGSKSATPSFQYTNDTTIQYAAAIGAGYVDSNSFDKHSRVYWPDSNGTKVMEAQDSNNNEEYGYGSLDLVAQNEIPNAGTEYGGEIDMNADPGDAQNLFGVLLMWE